jgi:hypothetical protein
MKNIKDKGLWGFGEEQKSWRNYEKIKNGYFDILFCDHGRGPMFPEE